MRPERNRPISWLASRWPAARDSWPTRSVTDRFKTTVGGESSPAIPSTTSQPSAGGALGVSITVPTSSAASALWRRRSVAPSPPGFRRDLSSAPLRAQFTHCGSDTSDVDPLQSGYACRTDCGQDQPTQKTETPALMSERRVADDDPWSCLRCNWKRVP